MDRRKIISATIAAAATVVTCPVRAETKVKEKSLFCYAPDDVFIKEIFVSNGRVKKGEKLILLSSQQIRRFQERIITIKELIEVYERPFKDGRTNQILKTINEQAESAGKDLYSAKMKVEEYILKNETGGGVSNWELEQAKATYHTAKTRKIIADTQLKHEPLRIKDSLDKIELAKRHLEKESYLLSEDEKKLTIVAPMPGVFFLEIGINGFVKKGDRIGVLQL